MRHRPGRRGGDAGVSGAGRRRWPRAGAGSKYAAEPPPKAARERGQERLGGGDEPRVRGRREDVHEVRAQAPGRVRVRRRATDRTSRARTRTLPTSTQPGLSINPDWVEVGNTVEFSRWRLRTVTGVI
jgi:hypothetical protein